MERQILTIRPATLQDCAALAHIEVDCLTTGYAGVIPPSWLGRLEYEEREQSWRSLLLSLTFEPFLVAELQDNQPVAFAYARPWSNSRFAWYDTEISRLHVHPLEQRRGIFESLLLCVIRSLLTLGCISASISTREGSPVQPLYERLKAKRVGNIYWDADGADIHEVSYGWDHLEDAARQLEELHDTEFCEARGNVRERL